MPSTSRRRNASALEHALLRYTDVGQFPEVQSLAVADQHELLLRDGGVAMLRDVMERHNVTHVRGLHWLVRHVWRNPGGLFSVEKFYARLESLGSAIARHLARPDRPCGGPLSRVHDVAGGGLRAQAHGQPAQDPPRGPGFIPAFDETGRANRRHALETVVRAELEGRRARATCVKTRDGFEADLLARSTGGAPALVQVAAELGGADMRCRRSTRSWRRKPSIHGHRFNSSR